jgi:hypothetical protein
MPDQETLSLDWKFVFQWLMATTAGWLIAWLFLPAVVLVSGGVAVSALQALVLYRLIPKAWRWIVYSVIGWLAGVGLVLALPPGLGPVSGVVLGAAVGTAQWLILRQQIRWAGWWIAASAAAWALGLAVGQSALPRALLCGSAVGMMTGFFFDILSNFPKQASLDNKS